MYVQILLVIFSLGGVLSLIYMVWEECVGVGEGGRGPSFVFMEICLCCTITIIKNSLNQNVHFHLRFYLFDFFFFGHLAEVILKIKKVPTCAWI